MTKQTWKQFQDSGLLWFINRTLHIFGWTIVFECNTATGEITDAYPARTTRLGFPADVDEEGQQKLIHHIYAERRDR